MNLTVDYLTDKTDLTYLFPGHKPTSVMLDSRSKQDIADVIANKDKDSFKTDFFTETPVFVKKLATKNK